MSLALYYLERILVSVGNHPFNLLALPLMLSGETEGAGLGISEDTLKRDYEY